MSREGNLKGAEREAKHRASSLHYYRANKEKYHGRSKQWTRNNPERAMWLRAKHHALKLNVPFTISVEDIKIPTHCPILGITLVPFGSRDCAPSLDRIRCELGYVLGNVRIISGRANRIKTDATPEELERIVKYMRDANAC